MNANEGNQRCAPPLLWPVPALLRWRVLGSKPPAEQREGAGKANTYCIGGLDKGKREDG